MKIPVMNRNRCFCRHLKHKSHFLSLHIRRQNDTDVRGQRSDSTCSYQTRSTKPYLSTYIHVFFNYTLLSEIQKKKKKNPTSQIKIKYATFAAYLAISNFRNVIEVSKCYY